MKKLQVSGMLLLLSMLLGLLAACGGETPTATAVPAPPTATLAPPPATATLAPPTNTVPPPSPTAVPATPTSAAMPATTADQALIMDAITATNGLKSYHAVFDGTILTETVNLEGDFVAPNQAYVKGTANNQSIEQLATGGKTYSKDASGKWTILSDTGSSGNGIDVNISNDTNIFGSLSPLLTGGTQIMDLGQDKVNGVQTRHFSGSVDAAALMGSSAGASGGQSMSLGTFNIWIDPRTKYIHKMTLDLDLAPFLRLMMGAFAGLAGTPGPGTPTPTPLPATMKFNLSVIISKHNDPSISIPAPPADAVPAPTNTPEAEATVATQAAATATAASGAVAATATAGGGSTSTGAHQKVGDTATVADLKITVNSAKEVPGKDLFQPGDGKRFVVVNVTIENTSDKEAAISTLLEMEMKDADGNTYDVDVAGAQQVATGKLPDGTLPAKGKVTGEIGYEVPKDAKGLVWSFKDFLTDAEVLWDVNP